MSKLLNVNIKLDDAILCDFIRISHRLGEMKVYSQAAGGNTSYKIDHQFMLVKASGYRLSEMSTKDGFAIVDYPSLVLDLKSHHHSTELSKFCLDGYPRPSLETPMHSLLGRFVFHLHPVYLFEYLCLQNGLDLLQKKARKFSYPWSWIEYKRPGDGLTRALLQSELMNSNEPVQVYFLENHGVIISLEKLEILEFVLSDLEQTFDSHHLMARDRSMQDLAQKIRHAFDEEFYCDCFHLPPIPSHVFEPVTPDDYVYWGFQSVEVNEENIIEEIAKYKKIYLELPKVLIYGDQIILIEHSEKKLNLLKEVFSAHYQFIVHHLDRPIKKMDKVELEFLRDWEAEKYRKNGGDH